MTGWKMESQAALLFLFMLAAPGVWAQGPPYQIDDPVPVDYGHYEAYVFGSTQGAYQPTIQTAWETLKLLANGIEPRPDKEGAAWNREQLQRIDLRWHDLRHEGACRLLADGVDIRGIQLMLGHASMQQTQRYLNVTDEELRKGLEVSWKNRGRALRLVSGN